MNLKELSRIFGTPSYVEIDLNDMLEEIGEEKTKLHLSYFYCPLNKDVENFLKEKAILFSKREYSKTTLVYWVSGDEKTKELVGYYTVTEKIIRIHHDALNAKERRKLHGYGEFDQAKRAYELPAPLIAQLGKNYMNGNNSLIDGKDLLQLAMRKIKLVQNIIGGKIAYLECEDIPQLVNFYTENHFKVFGKRELDRDETDIKGTYLLQLFTLI